MGRFFQSIRYACRGVTYVFKTEPNFRFQCVAGLAVLIAAGALRISTGQMLLVIFMVMLVLTMELLNTAVEHLIDLLKPRLHHYVETIKDIMAAAVFMTSLGALLIGLIIFLPYFVKWLG